MNSSVHVERVGREPSTSLTDSFPSYYQTLDYGIRCVCAWHELKYAHLPLNTFIGDNLTRLIESLGELAPFCYYVRLIDVFYSPSVDADVTVVGSGPGGYVAAIKSAQLGFKVTLGHGYRISSVVEHFKLIVCRLKSRKLLHS